MYFNRYDLILARQYATTNIAGTILILIANLAGLAFAHVLSIHLRRLALKFIYQYQNVLGYILC